MTQKGTTIRHRTEEEALLSEKGTVRIRTEETGPSRGLVESTLHGHGKARDVTRRGSVCRGEGWKGSWFSWG